MDPQDKKNQLQAMAQQVRMGGPGTARRKKKVVHRAGLSDDKKLVSTLKKMGATAIPGIEEVNMFKQGGQVIHFNNPKVQTSLQSNMFAISGHNETKSVMGMMPGILQQMGGINLRSFADHQGGGGGAGGASGDKPMGELESGKPRGGGDAAGPDIPEDLPELVENFDEASKEETT